MSKPNNRTNKKNAELNSSFDHRLIVFWKKQTQPFYDYHSGFNLRIWQKSTQTADTNSVYPAIKGGLYLTIFERAYE